MSEAVEPPFDDVWTIPGEEGELERFRAADRAAFQASEATRRYHELQDRDFLRALLEGRPPAVTAEEGRAVVQTIEAIYRGGRMGGRSG